MVKWSLMPIGGGPRPRSRLAGRAARFAALLVLTTDLALAKPKGEANDEAAVRADQKAVQTYVAGDSAGALRMLDHAFRLCASPNTCTSKTRARLHMSAGTVKGAGLGDYASAKNDFIVALGLDPDSRLSTALANPQLSATFEQARTDAVKPVPPPQKPPEKPPEKAPPEKPATITDLLHQDDNPPPPPPPKPKPPPREEGPEPRWNWVSARAMIDFAFITDANVCSPGAPSAYFCTENGRPYAGRPQPNDDVSSGFALSTGRLVLGFERLIFAGLTAGAFAGFAFGFSGAPEGRSGLFPLHLELRGTYTFGADPYLDQGPEKFHPFALVSLGIAEVDSHVVIRAFEIPCGDKAAPACKRDLDVHRRVGRAFMSLGGGVRYRIEGRHALRAALRTTLMFGDGSFVATPEVAYEYGL